ncbi:MAG: HEAT repeat domain-containing protein, partial [Nitrospirae bacterium]|nr:HEAT repeat domain-containing protein [Nitrospirota bacterium]
VDYTVDAFSKAADAVKKITPDILETAVDYTRKTAELTVDYTKKTTELIVDGLVGVGQFTRRISFRSIKLNAINLGAKDDLRDKITEYEGKIKNLYFEIGKEGASADQMESDRVRKMIEDVKEFEKEIKRLQGRILELEEMKREEALRKPESRRETRPSKKKQKLSGEQVDSMVKSSIEKALRHGTFETDSDKAIFNKIANDLLDVEMDVKILAATELGRIGNKASVDVLLEAVKYDNHYLTAEIINSLIGIGDPRAVALCKETASGANHKVRVNSLRGLYKLGKDSEIIPYLVDALRDEHSEVRRTAVTFLGWKDVADAVPGLIQSLQDKDESVRKAAVAALANIKDQAAVLPLMRTLADDSIEIRQKSLEAIKMITGKEAAFNIELTGEALTKAVNELKDWWQKERMEGIGEAVTEKYATVTTTEAEPPVHSHYAEPAPAHEAPAAESYAPEYDSEPEPVHEAQAEPAYEAAGGELLTESELKRMSKAGLVSLCESRGIECDDTYTKAELINLLQS